jgi:hypothetical protein
MLTFEAEKHIYRFDGRIVPSVTQVLEPLQHLDGVPWAILEAAREFGSHCHLACHLWNIDALDFDALDPHLVPYVMGWCKFLNETGFKVTESETPVHHAEIGYAGTPDCLGTWQNTTWVVDIKSGVVPCTVGPQLAAYQHAANLRPRRRLCIQLMPNEYRLHEQRDLGDFHIFLSALNVYKFLQKRNNAHVEQPA